jgi:Fur family ferric uptake transcriptional regulator
MSSPIEARCRAKGMRLTGPRRVIAEILSDAKDHPDVAELHHRVVQRCRKVSLATVYRTLKRLENEGIVARHEFGDGRARYEGVSSDHHDHLIDITTGAVIEFNSPEIEFLQQAMADRLGYVLVGHRLELYARPMGNKARRS